MKLKNLCKFTLCAMFAVSLVACTQTPDSADNYSTKQATLRVASLKGPTSIGLAKMMKDSADNYEFSVSATPDEVVSNFIADKCDIALVPANMASVLYNKLDCNVQVLNINTLSVLDVVSGAQLNSIKDLAGKTIYLTGKGSSPEYVMNYLLDKAGIKDSVTLEYKAEAQELVAELTKNPSSVCVIPQPFATVAAAKVDGVSTQFNLGDSWRLLEPSGSELVMGVTIVKKDFAAKHADAIAKFMQEEKDSIASVLADPTTAAKTVVEKGIIDNAQVAAKAIPNCNIKYLDGGELKAALSPYLQVLYNADAASIGGKLPSDDFYYEQ